MSSNFRHSIVIIRWTTTLQQLHAHKRHRGVVRALYTTGCNDELVLLLFALSGAGVERGSLGLKLEI